MILSFINRDQIISNRQFGFREGKSIEDAIFGLTNLEHESLHKTKPALDMSIGLSKAFDTLSQKVLLKRLYSYGIRGKVDALLKSYLTD